MIRHPKLCYQPKILLNNWLAGGDNFGPTSLQNTAQLLTYYKVIVDPLNNPSSTIMNSTSAKNKSGDITEFLHQQNNPETTPVDNVPLPIMTPN